MLDLNRNIPLLLSLVFVFGGLFVLSWSADKFVDASARLARAFGVSPLIVGMVIIGFGTSAPELAVSVLSGLADKADLSLGNAYGSCTFNLAAILGIAALVNPIKVKPSVSYFGVPILLGITALSYFLVRDNDFQRINGLILLAGFAVVMPLYCWFDQREGKKGKVAARESACGTVTETAARESACGTVTETAARESACGTVTETAARESACGTVTRPQAKAIDWMWLFLGLALLVGSSHVLVWGCVDFARDVLGVSPLLIGLTVVAAGTSLPELASAIASAKKKEHEFVIGNIVGSNIFNTLAVVGLSGTIAPFKGFSHYIVTRDLPAMLLMTLMLLAFGLNWRHPTRPGRIYRWEGVLWFLMFLVYVVAMIMQETGHWKITL